MSDEIPYRPRRRRSMDTLSTLDMPTPPYGLVDPTYRPGSIWSIPVPSANAEPPPPMRSGYRFRVGKLEIRCADRWRFLIWDSQLLELDAVDRILPQKLTALITLFENAIKRGHTILVFLRPFYKGDYSEVDILYRRLRSLWYLYITVGAALSEYEGTVPQEQIDWLIKSMDWVCDSLLQDIDQKTQQMGLSGVIRAAPEGLPAPTVEQRKVVERWARDMNKKHREDIDSVTYGLALFNFDLQLKSFEE